MGRKTSYVCASWANGKPGQYHGSRCIPRGAGTIAPSVTSGSAARSRRDSVSSRALRADAGFTTLDSMSRANESNCSPPAVVKSIAARDRRLSRAMFVKDGRYHATICSPSACAASTKRATRARFTMSCRIW